MKHRLDRKILIGLILATTVPFLLLFDSLFEVIPIVDWDLFWAKLIFITANTTGLIGTILLVWSFLLGIRTLVSLVTPDIVWSLKVHKWIGKYGLMLVLVHPVLEMLSYMKGVSWLFVPNFSSETQIGITIGRFAFILFLVIYISSAILRSKIKYRPWLYIHYLSYPMLFLTFLHANSIGTYLNKYIGLKALWFTLLVLFQILVVYRLIEWAGWSKAKYKLISRSVYSDDILCVTFQPIGRTIKPKAGQFVVLQIKPFGESHPFSIMEFDETTGYITLAIKVVGRFSKKVEMLNIDSQVKMVGPYGVFTREAQNNEPKVLIAGGVGITPFVDVINKFANAKTILLYSNKRSSQIILHDKFRDKLGLNYKAFITGEDVNTKSDTIYHRIDTSTILDSIGGKNKVTEYKYFLCGSPGFMKSITEMLLSTGVKKSQIYKEEFSY